MPDIFDASKKGSESTTKKSDATDQTSSSSRVRTNQDAPRSAKASMKGSSHSDPMHGMSHHGAANAAPEPVNPTHQDGHLASHEATPGPKNQHRPHRKVEEYSDVIRNEVPSHSPLDSFAPKPVSVFFDAQEKSEQIILLLRRHPITLIPRLVAAFVLILTPLLFSLVPVFSFLPDRFNVAALVLWLLLIIGFLLETFLTWFFNVYIITDERIIDVDFLSLIYKNISAAKIDNIEDVTSITGGAIRSIFNFGTVKIQTAGASVEIQFEDVPQPAKVTRLLNEMLLEEEREKIEGRVN